MNRNSMTPSKRRIGSAAPLASSPADEVDVPVEAVEATAEGAAKAATAEATTAEASVCSAAETKARAVLNHRRMPIPHCM
jgi:hypothetical protein